MEEMEVIVNSAWRVGPVHPLHPHVKIIDWRAEVVGTSHTVLRKAVRLEACPVSRYILGVYSIAAMRLDGPFEVMHSVVGSEMYGLS